MKRTPLVLLAVLAVVLPAPPASAAPPVTPPAGAAPARSTVTLITGDQVVTAGRGAALRVAGVRPGPGRDRIGHLTATRDGRVFVYPGDAVEPVRSGRLDERLFDVTGLVAMGYHDAHRTDLPLIVRGPAAGARVARDLPALDMTAVRQPTATTAAFWRSVRESDTRVWLDGRARISLDRSVPRVGAPAAWRRGHTGKGARVAVLDTGYDRDHPDLAGTVVADKDFTGNPAGTADGNGHGTHVASIVAGAGGRYRGVAPEADLVVGKVCVDEGWCPDSAILDGMAWAVDQRVSAVNLSLGAGPTDGTDPLSTAVNELTARTGVLFVVAAGNDGAGSTVSTPAAADAALAVGSVSTQDVPSPFSSRGPRMGDHAVKPDLAAPGADIVAARAAGTLAEVSVSEHHARLSGTSMATPHVTGAAAILAASHPDWRADRLKAALMGSAKPLGGVFTTGAGRLDVDAADRATLVADRGSLSFAGSGRQTLTYRNDGPRPVTLTPAVTVTDRDGRPAPGLVTVEPRTLTVPAGGSAPLTVSVRGEPGLFSGRLTAAGVVTALGVSIASEPGTLTITATAADDEQLSAFAIAQHERTGEQFLIWTDAGQPTPVPLPAGRYRVVGEVNGGVPLGDTGEYLITNSTMFAEVVDVTAAGTTLVLDGRTAGEVTRTVDDPRSRQVGGTTGIDLALPPTGDGHPQGIGLFTFNLHDVLLLPSERIEGLRLDDVASWQDPVLSTTVVGTGRELSLRDPDPVEFTGDLTAPLVDVGPADEPVPVSGAIALYTPPGDTSPEQAQARAAALREAGAALVITGEADYFGMTPQVPGTLSAYYLETLELREILADGPATLRVRGTLNSERAYVTHHQIEGALPHGVTWSDHRARMATVDLAMYTPAAPGSSVPLWTSFLTDRGYLDAVATELRPPARTTLHVTPGVEVAFDTVADWGEKSTGWQSSDPREFDPGERLTMNWMKAPYGPALATATPRAVRSGDKLTVDLPMFTNSGGAGRYGRYDPTTDTGTTTLTRDGRRVGHNDVPGLAAFDLPPGRGRYELTIDASHRLPYWPLATRVTDRWTFTSATTATPVPLPLLDIEYDLPLDLTNAAPSARDLTGSVRVGHQAGGSPVVAVTTEVSYDDGATWRRARVTPAGAGWTVRVPAGAPTARFASLRTTATDTAGNTLTETLVRAYAVSAVYREPHTG
ncbi:hypothetical protein BLA60_21075 [Actinophytocola xinjiangensis]|uniref:Peptidase S8/S53 domain-containing protein n=1 Tax=Actinophytocola xinjiangensis TaxID=485602 RepID=A0A7Z0WJX4_9PSEU|nr:S8 family serine peptidase [Actinophytocola xinjiangensis]OLF09080.1 hypothetical protein BLA60_21075 [Actinophytocola xinjiangensis]